MIIAGNLTVGSPSERPGKPEPAVAAPAAVSSETPPIVAFRLGAMVDQARADAAARQAEKRQAAIARKQARKQRQERFGDLPGAVTPETLEAIAECESGGDPEIVSSNGLYHGKYQFHPDTWESVGGKGLPSEASEEEQDYRAALLYERSGPGQWPVCGH